MSRLPTRFLARSLLQVAVLLLGAQAFAQTDDSLRLRLDAYLSELTDSGEFSGAVLVSVGDNVVLSKGYGFANIELEVPNSAETKFRIGSITKQFTAMAILLLQERGKLNVKDPLGRHLSGIPISWQELTLHQILTHTSGLMHSWNLPEFAESMMVPQSLDRVLSRFYDEPLLSPPGQQFNYSGLGYFILAKVVEEASGLPYHRFLEQEIFAPLGMENTGGDRPDVLLENRASGYVDGDELQNAPSIYMPILTGGGDLYSTVEDLNLWVRALDAGRLLSRNGYQALYKPELNNYAYGWWVTELNEKPILWHSGSVSGFQAQIGRIPGDRTHVVVLSNYGFAKAPTALVRLLELIAK